VSIEKHPKSRGRCPILFEEGAIWRRWDPHLHAPGTLLSDDFDGKWEEYLAAIVAADPPVEVLGITDYFSIGCYREVKTHFDAGKLGPVKAIFPNVELRLANATEGDRAINLHLLFDPADSDHVDQIERVLGELKFATPERAFRCTSADLMALGRKYRGHQCDDRTALCEGAGQFKVDIATLQDVWSRDKWMRDNCLVAFAAKSTDGTAGLQNDSSFKMLRQSIEAFSHICLNSSEKARQFWLGQHPDYPEDRLRTVYKGKSPACTAATLIASQRW